MKTYRGTILTGLFLLSFMLISANLSSRKGVMTVDAKVIKKSFVQKNGKELDFSEYYLEVKQHSYFIKWSESIVKPREIDPFVNKKVTLKIEIKDGLWDTSNPNEQSRIGNYAVLLKIIS